jgi:hypothetical protein
LVFAAATAWQRLAKSYVMEEIPNIVLDSELVDKNKANGANKIERSLESKRRGSNSPFGLVI